MLTQILNLHLIIYFQEYKKEFFMNIIVLLLTLWIFFKTVSYGVFEYQENNNKIGGVIIFILSSVSLLLPNAVVFINY